MAVRKTTELFLINGKPLLVPDEEVGFQYEDLDAADAGRDESGFMHRIMVRNKVGSWSFSYEYLTEEEKNYICSHIKVLPLRVIECMALQNTSLIPELLSQLDKPEEWYDYTYSNPTINNEMIPLYAQYEKEIKARIKKYI